VFEVLGTWGNISDDVLLSQPDTIYII
jgi:hypothetical protein